MSTSRYLPFAARLPKATERRRPAPPLGGGDAAGDRTMLRLRGGHRRQRAQNTAGVVRILRLGLAADGGLVQGPLQRSTRLHGLWHQTGSFRRGLGSTHRVHLLLVV